MYLNVTTVTHFAVDGTQVAVCAKTSQSMASFNSYCRLSKVELVLIGELDDVVMTKERKLDWKSMNKPNLNLVHSLSEYVIHQDSYIPLLRQFQMESVRVYEPTEGFSPVPM